YVNIDDENDDCGCEDDDCDCHDHEDDCCDDDCDEDEYVKELAKGFLKAEPKEPAIFAFAMVFGVCEETFEVLTQAVAKGDRIMRTAAMKLLVCLFTDMAWVERIVGFVSGIKDDEAKADAVRLLGRCGNLASRPFIMSCLNDKSQAVRAAAIETAEFIPGHNIVGSRLGAIITAGLR
ncbi:MAG: HEAT repeat domain-containing protein, partial [Victivallales bacterium]|nr:HEAT repeat domain-containing protein [Victivallales bacterium]